MKIVEPRQMNEIDSMTINKIGIPGIVLMENAATAVVKEIEKDIKTLIGKNIAIFAGKGNNGGDAFGAARLLYNKGAEIKVYLIGKKSDIQHDAAINLRILENMGIEITEILDTAQMQNIKDNLKFTDVILDGIFGTGLSRDVGGISKEVIMCVNESKKHVISIDIPSGICGLTGKVMGVCIKANKTVTFALPKIGSIIHPGCDYTGELVVADISIPSKVVESLNIKNNIIDKKMVLKAIPSRYANSNKGSYGKALVVTGSKGMTGAGILSAKAALRAGVGLVYLGVPASLTNVYDGAVVEAVTIPLEDKDNGKLSADCIPQIKERLKGMSVAALGPGLSTSEDIFEIVKSMIIDSEIPLVIDADALNVLAKDVSILKELKAGAVVTPHPGEMARLIGIRVEDVQNNRIGIAKEFASKWNVITVLKGSRTVVAFPDGSVWINTTGNPGMASGGTGDVLTGIIAGFAAQGVGLENAAIAGVYVHGLAGDSASGKFGEHGLVASDIIEDIPLIIKDVIRE